MAHSIYEELTRQIIEALKKGRLPLDQAVEHMAPFPRASGSRRGGPHPSAMSQIEPATCQRAEQFFGAIGARIEEGGDTASYSPIKDLIRMPRSAWFHRDVGYFATLAHELGHWTGHGKRLARDFKGRFGDPEYAKEELAAELAAAYVLPANELPGMSVQEYVTLHFIATPVVHA